VKRDWLPSLQIDKKLRKLLQGVAESVDQKNSKGGGR